MFWRKRIVIPEPNVPADWIERSLWQYWGPPRNHIAGEASYQTALATIVGATCDTGYCIPVPVTFIREPDNPYDRNACRAELHGVRICYMRREFASQISPALDDARCPRFGVCASSAAARCVRRISAFTFGSTDPRSEHHGGGRSVGGRLAADRT